MTLNPQNRTLGGGVATPTKTLPMASEPANKVPIAKPQIAPVGTPAAPPTLPLAPPAAAPTPAPQPSGGATAGQGINESSPRSAPIATNSTPATPTPFQTNDPLAFAPLPGATVTETADDLIGGAFMPKNGGASAGQGFNEAGPAVTEGLGFLPPPIGEGSPTVAGDPRLPVIPSADPPMGSAPTTSSNGAVNLTPTTPADALTNYTISPGELADRFGIAKDKIADWNAIEEPIYDRTIQGISQNRAGAGQLGSGMLRGSFRDAANDYNTSRLTAERGFLNDALGGSIDDAFKSVGVAQQQQGFQQGQKDTAFNQNVTLQQLQDSESGQQWTQLMQSVGFNADQMQRAWDNAYKAQQLSDDETGEAFNRAMQQAIFGAQGNPADILEWLAGLYALPQGFTGAGA